MAAALVAIDFLLMAIELPLVAIDFLLVAICPFRLLTYCVTYNLRKVLYTSAHARPLMQLCVGLAAAALNTQHAVRACVRRGMAARCMMSLPGACGPR